VYGSNMTSKEVFEVRRFAILILALIVLFPANRATSQHTEMSRAQSPELAAIVPGLGDYSRRISTKSPLAQKFFDQGLSLTYGYYFPEAIASFQEAARLDPNHPMIEWGLALAIGPNPNSRKYGFPDDPRGAGRKAISDAVSHLSRATAVERALVETLSVLYDSEKFPDRVVRENNYIEAAKRVARRYPRDLEAAFVYVNSIMTRAAWNYWRHDGSPQPGTLEAAATLERMLKLAPRHPGAVHLYVHLFESSRTPERALPQADLLESLMPKAGHIVHMPSHIYVRVGQYDKAIANNERSLAVDQYFVSIWGNHSFPTISTYLSSSRTHAPHALDVLRYAATLQGNYQRALTAARSMGMSHGAANTNPRQQRPPAIWLVNKAFGKWDALLAEPAPAPDRKYLQAVWHYLRGSAYVARGELSNAETELHVIEATSRDESVKDILSGANAAPTILQIISRALSGDIAMARGQMDEAIRLFREAVHFQDTLNFNEPPDWAQSIRLYLGEALLKSGRPKEAEAAYREELSDFYESGWALFGLSQSLRAQGRNKEADDAQARFKRAWKDADVQLTASVF